MALRTVVVNAKVSITQSIEDESVEVKKVKVENEEKKSTKNEGGKKRQGK
jgi:hypothetical protein